ncbi:MAG: Na/Pi symporter [Sulfuricurvum sp.]|nr:Na/Pi symporter [Sulfuricurvum sp.]
MYKIFFYPLFLLLVGMILFTYGDSRIIIAGIAIFLVGMVFMDDGFKLFSGGVLESILEKSTNTLPKAIGTGFAVTSVVQSSSLITVIVISFVGAGLMSLSSAIGVVFGANIGTTATAWIVSAFGVKIDIAHFAMPMLIFGVIFRFNGRKSYQGLGNILIGLGFIFLGIDYMKNGFDGLKAGLDLSQYRMGGLAGGVLFVMIGVVATVIIQSSSATVAIIITALASGQIGYINGLELAIGANIGTTITAIMGAMTSNANGKRLAAAHLIFNVVTGVVAMVLLYQLAHIVDALAHDIGIAEQDYGMKLALFHTVFNILGVVIVAPFTSKLVTFLEGRFQKEEDDIDRAKFLDDVVITIPDAALVALKKEVIHLYENSTEGFAHALSIHRHKFYGHHDIPEVIKTSTEKIDTNIDELYEKKIKILYGDIIHFTVRAELHLTEEITQTKAYKLKNASKNIVEALKSVKEIQKNIALYSKSKNEYLQGEYNFIRSEIAKTLDMIYMLQNNNDDMEAITKLAVLKEDIKRLDTIHNGRIDHLIRENKIDTKMATSIINDSSYAYDIIKRLIRVATVLWIADEKVQEMGELI